MEFNAVECSCGNVVQLEYRDNPYDSYQATCPKCGKFHIYDANCFDIDIDDIEL